MIEKELDKIDLEILKENYDEEIINQLDIKNANKIYEYLNNDGIYYVKDIFLGLIDVFFIDYNEFVNKYEQMKLKIGDNYIEEIADDLSLLEEINKF